MEIVSCAKCGQPLLDDTQRCPFCGAPPQLASPSQASSPASIESKARGSAEPAVKQPAESGPPPKKRKSDRYDLDDLPESASESSAEAAEPVVELPTESPPRPTKRKSDRFDLDDLPDFDPESAAESEDDSTPAVTAPRKARYQLDEKFRGFMDTALPVRGDARGPGDVEVVCPICRWKGFIPPTAIDKPLRCRNAQCPAPVFVHRNARAAEPVQSRDEAVAQTPRRTGLWILRGVAVVLVLAALGGWWWNQSRREPPAPPVVVRPRIQPTVPTETPPEQAPGKNAGPPVDPETLRKSVLASLTDSFRNAPPNRRGTGLRLTATAAALAGDFTAAQEQLAQFRVVPELAPFQFEAIEPLTILAWKHLEAKRQAAFLEAVVSAGEAAQKLPARGRYSAQMIVRLAAVQVVGDRKNNALKLVATYRNGDELDSLAAALAIAHEDGTFDVSQLLPGQTSGAWERPLPTAVTYILVARRQNKSAEAWAREQPDEVARVECRLLRASLITEQALAVRAVADPALLSLPGLDLTPEAEARWHARLAVLYLAHGLKSAASEALDLAGRELPKVPVPPAARINDIKELLQFVLPAENPRTRTTVEIAADVAYAQTRLGRLEAASETLTAALAQWRATAPSLLALQTIEQKILEGGPSAARKKLRDALDLENDDAAAIELTRLRQKLAQLQPAAERRFRNQEKLLLAALEWGLLDTVWKEIQLRHTSSDPNEQEPYLRSALPQLLVRRFAAARQTAQQQQVEALLARVQTALGSAPTIDNPLPLIQQSVGDLAIAGKLAEAGRLLNAQIQGEKGELPLWTLRLVCRLAANGQFEKVVELLVPIREATIREEGFRLAAALATLQHQEQQVLEIAAGRAAFPLESAAMYAGVLEGLSRRPTEPGKSTGSPPTARP